MTERPVIDYANLPHLPREGVQSPLNNKFHTRCLFLETALAKHEEAAKWCLSEHEIFAHGKWYPSAWMAYISATDEYDACRKICGNIHQWELIKAYLNKQRPTLLLQWESEQKLIQRSQLMASLKATALDGGAGAVSAAKVLLTALGNVKPVGRPSKRRIAGSDVKSTIAEDAIKRMALDGV